MASTRKTFLLALAVAAAFICLFVICLYSVALRNNEIAYAEMTSGAGEQSDGNLVYNQIAAIVTFDENGAADGGVVTTSYATFEEAWNYAAELSTSADYRATVKLFASVSAANGSFGTGAGFGSSDGYITVLVHSKFRQTEINEIGQNYCVTVKNKYQSTKKAQAVKQPIGLS